VLALLKLIPIKDLIYGAVILGLVGWIFHKGELSIEHKDAKVAVSAEKQVAAGAVQAQTTETQNALIYEKAVAVPAIGDLGVVCSAPRGSSLSAASPGQGASTGKPAADSNEGRTYDPSGPALTRAAEADAQIIYLQGRIRELEAQMNAAP